MKGNGRMVVTAVGMNSLAGIILLLLDDEEQENQKDEMKMENQDKKHSNRKKEKSVLQEKLTKLSVKISYGGKKHLIIF